MKRNYLLASLLAIAAMFTGCSEVDEFFTPNTSKTYEASVIASKEKVEGLWDAEEEGTRAVFVGGNNRRFATLWDEDDVVRVYKDGVEIGTMSLNTTANKPYQGTKDAYLSGTLTVTGNIQAGDDVTLYLTSRENLVRPYTGQTGSINDLSKNFSYQTKTVKVASVDGNKITLEKANMDHQQAYLRFVLTDEEGNRLHPQQLIISADPIDGYDGQIVTSVAADNSEEYGDLVINAEADCGEYPGELFVAVLNENDNAKKVNYHLTVINEDGVTYTGPNTVQVNTTDDRPCRFAPPKGELNRVWRKLAKVEPTVELGTQMKMVVGTNRTRVPKVTVTSGETTTDISSACTFTYSSSNNGVASVDNTGKVIAHSTGNATITVNIAPYNVSRTYAVTVTEPVTEFVDLGLSVNWATMNVGAESETDYGTYFAWGETEGWTSEYDYDKVTFTWDTYKWGDGTTFTKYTTDGLITLEAADDAAVQNWGGNWRMPTIAEFNELATNYPTSTQSGTKRSCWGEKNGVNGLFFYDADDNELMFWPAAGYITGSSLSTAGAQGYYSTASLRSNDATNQRLWRMWFSSVALASTNGSTRRSGQTVRAVQPKISASFAKSTLTILPGKERTYRPTVTQSGNDLTSGCTITYSTSNYSVASVKSTTGEVKGISEGTATITATIQPYGITANYEVHVYNSMPATYAVDLGLPSGIKWASMNVGAESETDYGTYFAWGETEGYTNEYDYEKDEYNWNTYKWGTSGNLTKYNGTDGKTILDASDDAATQNWGSGWRMPTSAEFNALLTAYPYSTDSGAKRRAFVTRDGVKMLIFYSAEDDELLILPCAGSYQNGSIRLQNTSASYWTSSRQSGNNAYMFDSYNSTTGTSTAAYGRSLGFQVRPVYVGQ